MSKLFELSDGKIIDFDMLYPLEKRLPKNHFNEYDPKDDIYGEVTDEEKEK